MIHNQSLSLANLNLPSNPTARKFLELIGHYQVRYTVHNDGPRFTAPDLESAKGNKEKDFVKNFLPNLKTSIWENLSQNSSLFPHDVWVLEYERLKFFKQLYQEQLGISLGRINKLTVVGYETAYLYLSSSPIRKEYDFREILNSVVGWKYEVRTQQLVKVGDRRFFLDFYLPELNIAIEFDEIQHEYSQEKDKERQKAIQKKLKCKFIRVKEGQEYRALEEISKAVFQ